jgi:hypothetical protein
VHHGPHESLSLSSPSLSLSLSRRAHRVAIGALQRGGQRGGSAELLEPVHHGREVAGHGRLVQRRLDVQLRRAHVVEHLVAHGETHTRESGERDAGTEHEGGGRGSGEWRGAGMSSRAGCGRREESEARETSQRVLTLATLGALCPGPGQPTVGALLAAPRVVAAAAAGAAVLGWLVCRLEGSPLLA